MLKPAVTGATIAVGATSSPSGWPANSATGSVSFADILTLTAGTACMGDTRAAARATGAAAAAASDVDMLSKLVGAFGDTGPGSKIGVATIDQSGRVTADASLGVEGDLSVFGSGASGETSTAIDISLSAAVGSGWLANASSELAQARCELNALIRQSTAAAGVDRAA
jgi:hypothetical protein